MSDADEDYTLQLAFILLQKRH